MRGRAISTEENPQARSPLIINVVVLVLAVIGLAVVRPGFGPVISADEQARRMSTAQLKVLRGAILSYYQDMNQYPVSLPDLVNKPTKSPKPFNCRRTDDASELFVRTEVVRC
jgi:type II secretory pathway pseudopilin PulG